MMIDAMTTNEAIVISFLDSKTKEHKSASLSLSEAQRMSVDEAMVALAANLIHNAGMEPEILCGGGEQDELEDEDELDYYFEDDTPGLIPGETFYFVN